MGRLRLRRGGCWEPGVVVPACHMIHHSKTRSALPLEPFFKFREEAPATQPPYLEFGVFGSRGFET